MLKVVGRTIKHVLSFSVLDVVGIFLGIILLWWNTDASEVFYTLSNPQFYIILFLILFLIRSRIWLLVYRGESPYLKHSLIHVFKDYFHIIILCICTIGTYLLLFSLL